MRPDYATFGQRFVALVIDSFVITVACLPFMALDWYLLHRGLIETEPLLFSVVPETIIVLGYTIVGHARYGKTLGKHLMSIRVVRLDYAAIGWRGAWLRSAVDVVWHLFDIVTLAAPLLGITLFSVQLPSSTIGMDVNLSLLALWTLSEVVVMLCNDQRRALHDFIAGTIVIDERHAPTRPATM